MSKPIQLRVRHPTNPDDPTFIDEPGRYRYSYRPFPDEIRTRRSLEVYHEFLLGGNDTIIEGSHLQNHLALFKSLTKKFSIASGDNGLPAFLVDLHLDLVTVLRRA